MASMMLLYQITYPEGLWTILYLLIAALRTSCTKVLTGLYIAVQSKVNLCCVSCPMIRKLTEKYLAKHGLLCYPPPAHILHNKEYDKYILVVNFTWVTLSTCEYSWMYLWPLYKNNMLLCIYSRSCLYWEHKTHIDPLCRPERSWTCLWPLPSPSHVDSSRSSGGGCGRWRTGSWSRSCWRSCGLLHLFPAR